MLSARSVRVTEWPHVSVEGRAPVQIAGMSRVEGVVTWRVPTPEGEVIVGPIKSVCLVTGKVQ